METFIILNAEGNYGVEITPTGFGGNGTTKANFQSDINKATLFNGQTYALLNADCKSQVVAKIPATEQRIVRLVK